MLERPWGAVIEVLKHEMAHQYVHEVLGETEQTPHGRAFREACARMGVDARASGVPDAPPGTGEEKIVERITRLLALAESPNRHEAEAAMAAAQRLMLKHNLDAARAHAPADYGFLHLGQPSGRVGEHERLVAMILGAHFFVEAIWVPVYRPLEGKRGSVLEIVGSRGEPLDRRVRPRLPARDRRAPLGGRTARRAASARTATAAPTWPASWWASPRRSRARSGPAATQGLVWVRDGDLTRYFRHRHPHVRHVRHAGQRRTDAWAHGREAGPQDRACTIRSPIPGTSRGRLLPPRGPESTRVRMMAAGHGRATSRSSPRGSTSSTATPSSTASAAAGWPTSTARTTRGWIASCA